MICFITSGAHKYAVRELRDVSGMPQISLMSYNQLLRKKALPRAVYVFTDLDRIDFWTRELAAKACRCLKAAGLTVLNDPATTLTRLPMLKRLQAEGLNSFSVWDAETDGLPDRYPVFLRTRAAHRGAQTDLLETPEAAQAALREPRRQRQAAGRRRLRHLGRSTSSASALSSPLPQPPPLSPPI